MSSSAKRLVIEKNRLQIDVSHYSSMLSLSFLTSFLGLIFCKSWPSLINSLMFRFMDSESREAWSWLPATSCFRSCLGLNPSKFRKVCFLRSMSNSKIFWYSDFCRSTSRCWRSSSSSLLRPLLSSAIDRPAAASRFPSVESESPLPYIVFPAVPSIA